ncbi:MAG TPA: hypothetical protein VEF04_07090, partial [Blastocatellia bacterium]|nr:hypothetical protein [Blastocatellia bacterium]
MWTLLTCLTFLTIQANSQNSFSKHNPNAEHISKTSQRIKEITASLPLSFEANRGQVDSHIKFLSRGDGYNLLLAANEVTFNLSNSKLRMQFIGANQTPKLRGLERLPGHSNYFIGNDQSRWQSNVPNFSRVEYVEIYRGINLIFYGQQRQLEYDFVVQPGADPNKIKFSFEGYQRIKLDQAGNLVLETNDGQVIQHKPVVYQEINGVKQLIPSKYILDA